MASPANLRPHKISWRSICTVEFWPLFFRATRNFTEISYGGQRSASRKRSSTSSQYSVGNIFSTQPSSKTLPRSFFRRKKDAKGSLRDKIFYASCTYNHANCIALFFLCNLTLNGRERDDKEICAKSRFRKLDLTPGRFFAPNFSIAVKSQFVFFDFRPRNRS